MVKSEDNAVATTESVVKWCELGEHSGRTRPHTHTHTYTHTRARARTSLSPGLFILGKPPPWATLHVGLKNLMF